MEKLIKSAAVGLIIFMFVMIASGQDAGRQQEVTCSGPIYRARGVTRRAKITYVREPGFTEEARAHGVEGTVVLTAVLCRTGKVTDIKVIESLPDGLTEAAVESTRGIKFEPAEKDGEAVSQHLRRELHFTIYRGRWMRTRTPNNGMHPTRDTPALMFLHRLGRAGDAGR